MKALRMAALAAAGIWFAAGPLQAAPQHGIAMHGAPKYAADFKYLDYANPDAPKGGTLRLSTIGTFDSLNPWIIKGTPAAGRNLYYETLLKRVWDEPFTLYGLIASSVEVPDDRSWVEFTLRPEAHFSDGAPITVDDVIFSWETIRTLGRPNSRATYNKVVRVERVGERGVRFVFPDGSDRELPLLIGGFLPILAKHYWADRDFTKTTLDPPVSSGPYLIAKVDQGVSITYRRDPNYWGADLPINVGHNNFDEIRYEYFRDGDVALEAFKAGEYDFRYEFNPTRWANQYDFPAVRDGRVRLDIVKHGIPSGLRAFAFNLRRPLFEDRRVRAALSLAFDFPRINRTLLNGAFFRTTSMFSNSDMAPLAPPGPDELALLAPWRGVVPDEAFRLPFFPTVTFGSEDNRENLRQATMLLRDAGWRVEDGKLVGRAGEPFAFEIMLQSPSNKGVALAFADNLERLGIEARVRLVDSAQYQARIEDFDFDMAIRRWGVTLSPGNEQQNYWSSATADAPGSRNTAGVSDPAVDWLIDRLVGARTRDELVTAAKALDRVIMWNHYVIPMYHQPGFRLAQWRSIARPATVPIYGTVLETFWSADAPAAPAAPAARPATAGAE